MYENGEYKEEQRRGRKGEGGEREKGRVRGVKEKKEG